MTSLLSTSICPNDPGCLSAEVCQKYIWRIRPNSDLTAVFCSTTVVQLIADVDAPENEACDVVTLGEEPGEISTRKARSENWSRTSAHGAPRAYRMDTPFLSVQLISQRLGQHCNGGSFERMIFGAEYQTDPWRRSNLAGSRRSFSIRRQMVSTLTPRERPRTARHSKFWYYTIKPLYNLRFRTILYCALMSTPRLYSG